MWLLLAGLCAFLTATADALSKVAMERADEYIVGWFRLILSIPFLALAFLWIKVPRLDLVFLRTLFLLLPLEVFAYILFLKAIRKAPLSLTLPFLALTPVFTIGTSFILLGERLKMLGILGIVCIVLGAYFLNVNMVHLGLLAPLRTAFKEKGTLYMIIVAFIYSITSNLGKIAIIHSSPTFFPVVYFPVVAVAFTPIVITRSKMGLSKMAIAKNPSGERGRPRHLQALLYIVLGFVFALAIFTHCLAISKAYVPYMISVKRMSLLFGVMYGGLIFKEDNIRNRLSAASLMVLGVILIGLA